MSGQCRHVSPGGTRPYESRRTLYRRSRRLLVRLLAGRWPGHRPALERAARGFLRDRPRNYFARVVGDRRFALAVAAAIVAGTGATTATALPPVNLSDVAAGTGGFVINGIDPVDESGRSVSGAGDVNGDGLADVIVGAYRADPGGIDRAGESYVIFGKADGTSVNLTDVAAGIGGFVINGIDQSDYSGQSVSGAGDVNGDGLADLIVGAYRADPDGKSYAGETYVVFGKVDTAPVNLSAFAAGDGGGFVINGIDQNDFSGRGVSGAGDVNGDGLADLIVGATGADPVNNSSAGESYLIFGKADTTPVNLAVVAAGVGGFVINGIDQNDFSGCSVSGAGDVNGDGLADFIIGAPNADPGFHAQAGESYVVFGKADTAPVNLADVAAGIGGFIINGIDAFDYSGSSVSSAGDVNGDGLADVIVGAYRADSKATSSGESYVVFGKAGTTPVNLADVAAGTGGFVIKGINAGDNAGLSVSGAGDVNGDGLADLIVGAYGVDQGGNDYGYSESGQSYVVFGKASTTQIDLADVVAGIGGFVINGIHPYDYSGVSVSGAGDINGDGVPDLIVGAYRADPGGINRAGESYVIFGQSCPWDCADGDGSVGIVGIVDFLALLADWGGPGACDLDGGGIGITDFLELLGHWGPCP